MTPYGSAVEQTQAHLEQSERLNPRLNALIAIRRDQAIAQAQEADRIASRGESMGVLHGMTVSVKDNIDIAGEPTTAGAEFLRDNLAARDATVVQRLRQAGAILVSKANMAELAFGSRSYSAVGQCRNPWNDRNIPGGSSGGSAVSVAADMCTGSLGTDTGGSVRLPSCYNGVSGLRPTLGRIPNTGVVPVSEHYDTVGPIARSVYDVARLFSVLAGYDAADGVSVDRPVPNFLPHLHAGIQGRRIGLPGNHYFEALGPGVGEAVLAGARILEQAGAVLVDIHVPLAGEAHLHQSRAVFSDICHQFDDALTNRPESITASVVERMRHGLAVTGVQYAEALAFRNRYRVMLREIYSQVDIVLSPTAPQTAPLIDDGANLLEATKASTRNTYAGSVGALPGLSVPCGFDAQGLPIGMQLEAAWWQEDLLFQAGIAFQRETDHHLRRSPLLS